ncbi:hypothetical protein PCYB_003210 [Plasmodium cynomolgi strain B]|uniref:CYIR protein n=1 Tax=Plasmodium cynomolgi (strain B) TaxID=1120755 RepID=K6VJJ1_PLACD|nr:hypothetical protein PCYB_003210 [Plasmodium cynomolgi strain B]GAB69572.1 hypothetical protein PCYB_003210 [Plasmodium cynomolgi strain B]
MTLISLKLQSSGQPNCIVTWTNNISKTFFDQKKLVYEYSQDYEEIQNQLNGSGNSCTEEYSKYLTNADLAYRVISAHCRGPTPDNRAYCDEFGKKYSKYMDKDGIKLKCTKVSQGASLRSDSSGDHAPAAAGEEEGRYPGQKNDHPTQDDGKAHGAEAKPTAPDNGDTILQTVGGNSMEGKEAHANGKGVSLSQGGNPEQSSAPAVATSQDEQTSDTHQQSEIVYPMVP